MAFRKKFITYWKNHYNLLSVPLYSLILIVVEETMEIEFKCPQKDSLKKLYSAAYFYCPAVITFFLSLTCHPAFIPSSCCKRRYSCIGKCDVVIKSFLPPLIWCLILLCDGRYADCFFSPTEGTSATSATGRVAAEFPSELYVISQVVGLHLLILLVLFYGIYHVYPPWFCCQSEEEHQKEQLEILLEGEVKKRIEDMKEDAANEVVEKRLKQGAGINSWKITAKGINEVVASAVRDIWNRVPRADQPREHPSFGTEMTTR